MKRFTNKFLKLCLASVAVLSFSSAANAATQFPNLLKNTASVKVPAGYTDTDLTNNIDDQDLKVGFKVDLKVTKTDNVVTYVPGESGTYEIVVTNGGVTSAEDVTVNDTLPTGMTVKSIVSCVATGTSSCGTLSGAGQPGDTSFEFTGGRVQAGGVDNLTITLEVDYASNMLDPVTNIAKASDTFSGNSAEGEDETNEAAPVSDLAIAKNVLGSITDYVPGGSASYELVVTNKGPSDVIGAEILDNLPAGVTLSGPWTCTADALGSACSVATGGAAAGTSVSLTADVVDGGTVTIVVPVTFDSDVANY